MLALITKANFNQLAARLVTPDIGLDSGRKTGVVSIAPVDDRPVINDDRHLLAVRLDVGGERGEVLTLHQREDVRGRVEFEGRSHDRAPDSTPAISSSVTTRRRGEILTARIAPAWICRWSVRTEMPSASAATASERPLFPSYGIVCGLLFVSSLVAKTAIEGCGRP